MEAGTIEIDAEAHAVVAREPLREGTPLPLYGLRIGRLRAVEAGPDGVRFTYGAAPGWPPRFRAFATLRDEEPVPAHAV